MIWRANGLRVVRAAGPLLVGSVALAVIVEGDRARWAGPVLLAGVAASIPHGAFDYLVAAPVGDRRRLLGWTAAYTAAGVAGLAALVAAPAIGLAALLTVSAAHFAEGEVRFVRLLHDRPRRPVVRRPGRPRPPAPDRRARGGPTGLDWAYGVAVGALAVLGPLVAQPVRSRRLLQSLLGASIARPTGTAGALVVAGVLVAVVGLAALLAAVGARLEAGELGVLLVASWVVPPGALIGLYLAAWHAPRHLARIFGNPTPGRPGRGRPPGGGWGAGGRPTGRGRSPRLRSAARRLVPAVWPLAATAAGATGAHWGLGVGWERIAVLTVLSLSVPHALVVVGMGPPRSPIRVSVGASKGWTSRRVPIR